MRSCTVAVLAQAVQELFGYKGEVTVTGPRGGEKRHETLISLEEMPRTADLGGYLCISQNRRPDAECRRTAYTSDAGTLLHAGEVAEILREVDVVKEALRRWNGKNR